ncbi:fungal hydrophobin [Mycena polygramma]|nr:fungal hydrophobin [Mycena polygramma]
MFSKLSVVLASVLIAVAAARPSGYGSAPPPVTPPTSNQCCTSVLSSTDSAVSAVAGILRLDLSGINVPVGLGCSPITVIGNNCGSTTVTCDAPEKEWGSLIAINCLPITL